MRIIKDIARDDPELQEGLFALQALERPPPAPALRIAEWVQGDRVNLVERRRILVVIFCATPCPASRASLRVLTEIQERFKGQGVVLAGLTSADFLRLLNEPRVPEAFMVDTSGGTAWHGHPLGGLEEALQELASGKYDRPDLLEVRDPQLKYLPGANENGPCRFQGKLVARWSLRRLCIF